MAGDMHNNSVEQQEIRIKLTSNEPIKDNDWLIYGYPHTLRLEKSTGRNNNAKEKLLFSRNIRAWRLLHNCEVRR